MIMTFVRDVLVLTNNLKIKTKIKIQKIPHLILESVLYAETWLDLYF